MFNMVSLKCLRGYVERNGLRLIPRASSKINLVEVFANGFDLGDLAVGRSTSGQCLLAVNGKRSFLGTGRVEINDHLAWAGADVADLGGPDGEVQVGANQRWATLAEWGDAHQ